MIIFSNHLVSVFHISHNLDKQYCSLLSSFNFDPEYLWSHVWSWGWTFCKHLRWTLHTCHPRSCSTAEWPELRRRRWGIVHLVHNTQRAGWGSHPPVSLSLRWQWHCCPRWIPSSGWLHRNLWMLQSWGVFLGRPDVLLYLRIWYILKNNTTNVTVICCDMV